MIKQRGKNMKKRYEIKIEENPKKYLRIFYEQHKKDNSYKHRKRNFRIVTLLFCFLLSTACYMDFGNIIFSDMRLGIILIPIFLYGGYMLPYMVFLTDMRSVYNEYWKLRKMLYEDGTYTEKVTFLPEGIEFYEKRKGKAEVEYMKYSQIKQISFMQNGIILQPYKYKYFIYITDKQVVYKPMVMKQIKTWYQEYVEHDKN